MHSPVARMYNLYVEVRHVPATLYEWNSSEAPAAGCHWKSLLSFPSWNIHQEHLNYTWRLYFKDHAACIILKYLNVVWKEVCGRGPLFDKPFPHWSDNKKWNLFSIHSLEIVGQFRIFSGIGLLKNRVLLTLICISLAIDCSLDMSPKCFVSWSFKCTVSFVWWE